MAAGHEPPPLPDHPALAAVARAIEAHGFAAEIWDAGWRLAYLSGEYRVLIAAGRTPDQPDGIGEHFLSPEQAAIRESWPAGPLFDSLHESLREWGDYIVAATPGGREALHAIADPRFGDLLDELIAEPRRRPGPRALTSATAPSPSATTCSPFASTATTVRSPASRRCSSRRSVRPYLGMLALGDARLFEQMSGLITPARRPAAVLFADLENSTPLSRRLSTPAYFALIRRLTSRSDRAVVSAGGIVGKHVGDGVTAFFLARRWARSQAPCVPASSPSAGSGRRLERLPSAAVWRRPT